jgi:hypothetical protein
MHSEQYSLLVLLYIIIHFALPSFFFYLTILIVCCSVHFTVSHHITTLLVRMDSKRFLILQSVFARIIA